MKKIELRKNGTKRVATFNTKPSRTDTSFQERVNVNSIIGKFMKTGQINHLRNKQGLYADVSQISDLSDAADKITRAQHAFSELPSHLRNRFENPIEMVRFLSDPKNHEEAVELGIFEKAKEATPTADLAQPPLSSKRTPKAQPKPSETNDDSNDDN